MLENRRDGSSTYYPYHHNNRSNKVSRLNGENIAGAAFLFLSFLFIMASQVNAVFALLYPVYYILIATGIALILIGYRTWGNNKKSISYL